VVKGKGKRFINIHWKMESISIHLWGTDMSLRFKQRNSWGMGERYCIIVQSWSVGVKDVNSLIIISKLVRWGLVRLRKSLLWGGSFDSCHMILIHQSCTFRNPRWLQERMSQSKEGRYEMEAEHLQAQVKSQCF
jgi:hypothetical protein